VSRYRAGIIGLTGIAVDPPTATPTVLGGEQPHAHAGCYAVLPQTEVVAVCDLVPSLFERFRGHWGQHWPTVATYTDYRAMLAAERLDLLSIVTPDDRHAKIVIAAVGAGIKGIYCEKPIATTLADADRMIAAVETAGIPMVVNHTRRWYASYQQAWAMVQQGAIGRVTHIQAACGGPRAMLFRNATHLIDLAVWFADAEPVWVVAQLDPGQEQYGPRYAGDGGRDPATDPGGRGLVRFANGVIASIFCSKQINSQSWLWEFTVYGEQGQLRLTEPGGLTAILPAGPPLGGLAVHQIGTPQLQRVDGAAAIAELIDLIEQPAAGRQGQSPPRAARHVLAILLAMLQSQHRGNQPVSAPFTDATD
jgi:predicted dehydrogenase